MTPFQSLSAVNMASSIILVGQRTRTCVSEVNYLTYARPNPLYYEDFGRFFPKIGCQNKKGGGVVAPLPSMAGIILKNMGIDSHGHKLSSNSHFIHV